MLTPTAIALIVTNVDSMNISKPEGKTKQTRDSTEEPIRNNLQLSCLEMRMRKTFPNTMPNPLK